LSRMTRLASLEVFLIAVSSANWTTRSSIHEKKLSDGGGGVVIRAGGATEIA
jgi:hypothetical protein